MQKSPPRRLSRAIHGWLLGLPSTTTSNTSAVSYLGTLIEYQSVLKTTKHLHLISTAVTWTGEIGPHTIRHMRLDSRFLAVMLVGISCINTEAKNKTPDLQLNVSDDGTRFHYSIRHPEEFRRAWIEVLDSPTVLDSRPVAIQRNGEFDWEWNRTALNDYESDEDVLTLSLWDPDGETLICEGTVISAHPGGEVSQVTVGGRTRFSPEPRLGTSLVRVAQGGPSFTFDVLGADLTSNMAVHVFAEKGAQCTDRQVHTQALDLTHARVTINRECLSHPGILSISPQTDSSSYDDYRAWIYVASRTSPTLNSVAPHELRVDATESQLRLVLRGEGFNKNSQVHAGPSPQEVYFSLDQVVLITEYISSTELRAKADPSYGDDPLDRSTHGGLDPLRIWVEGDEKRFELSEFRDIRVQPLPGRRVRPTAVITSVSPFPVRLMKDRSADELQLTIHGQNFVPENKVIASFGNSANNQRTLRTTLVSGTTLRAWIPRQYWRKHHLRYRLTVETSSGRRHTRNLEAKDEN